MLAFAGIPLTSGFTGKFAVFAAGDRRPWQTWLVIAGVVTSMILAFPYLRVVVMMWLSEPGEQTPTVSDPGRAHLGRAHGRRARHARARRRADAGAGPREQGRRVHPLSYRRAAASRAR